MLKLATLTGALVCGGSLRQGFFDGRSDCSLPGSAALGSMSGGVGSLEGMWPVENTCGGCPRRGFLDGKSDCSLPGWPALWVMSGSVRSLEVIWSFEKPGFASPQASQLEEVAGLSNVHTARVHTPASDGVDAPQAWQHKQASSFSKVQALQLQDDLDVTEQDGWLGGSASTSTAGGGTDHL